jgi:hypothetical protein
MHDNPDVAATDAEPGSDLEYDLAHESTGGIAAGGDLPPRQDQRPSVYVPTETKDYDGDYGYDLAHDVPGR